MRKLLLPSMPKGRPNEDIAELYRYLYQLAQDYNKMTHELERRLSALEKNNTGGQNG